MRTASNGQARAAIILAGGDGTRLSELTRKITGHPVPKQFCALVGERPLLAQTRERVSLSVSSELTMFALNREHERFYAPLVADVPQPNLIAQPRNLGTAPAILYALLRLAAMAPQAPVVLIPSDHHFGDEVRFMQHVDQAFAIVARRPELTVLMAMVPDAPETSYGWIEPGAVLEWKVRAVRRFWEKPSAQVAGELMARGCLWNSFVIVARVSTLLGLFLTALPGLCAPFYKLRPVLGTSSERRSIDRLYQDLRPADFSREVLAVTPANLATLPVPGVGWSDLGEPSRVFQALGSIGAQPRWVSA